MKHRVVSLFSLLLCLFTIASCGCGQREEVESGGGFLKKLLRKEKTSIPVTVANALMQERSLTIKVPGKLIPSDRIDIRLPYEVRIERSFVGTGDAVALGDPLIKLSEEENAFKIAQKRVDVRDLQSELEKKQYLLRNRDRLYDEGRMDRSEYDALEGEIADAEGKLEKLRLEIQAFEAQLEKLTITSPIAGVVEKRDAGPGLIIPSGTPLITLIQIDPMLVAFELSAHEASAVQSGQNISVSISDLPGERVVANVTAIGTTLAPEVKTFPVKAAFRNPGRIFKAGMAAEIEFVSDKKQRFYVVPTEAIITDGRRHFVFTVVKGTARRIRVIPRESRGTVTEIIEGLREDDLIVVKGHEQLEDGMVVDIWGG